MIIDNKGRLFGKVSIIDALIVLIIIAGLAGVGYKFTKAGKASPFTKQDNIVIDFYHDETRDFNANSIKVGDSVKDAKTNAYIGKVSKVEVKESKSIASDDKGQYHESAKPGAASIHIIVDGTGIYRDGITGQGVSIGGTDYFIGASTQLYVGKNVMWAFVYNIDKKE